MEEDLNIKPIKDLYNWKIHDGRIQGDVRHGDKWYCFVVAPVLSEVKEADDTHIIETEFAFYVLKEKNDYSC